MVSRLARSKTTTFSGFFGTSTEVARYSGSWSSAATFRSHLKVTVSTSAPVVSSALEEPPQPARASADAATSESVVFERIVRMGLPPCVVDGSGHVHGASSGMGEPHMSRQCERVDQPICGAGKVTLT
jgi:hypothetical protein